MYDIFSSRRNQRVEGRTIRSQEFYESSITYLNRSELIFDSISTQWTVSWTFIASLLRLNLADRCYLFPFTSIQTKILLSIMSNRGQGAVLPISKRSSRSREILICTTWPSTFVCSFPMLSPFFTVLKLPLQSSERFFVSQRIMEESREKKSKAVDWL